MAVVRPRWVDAQTGRTIGEDNRRDTQTGYGYGCSGGTRHDLGEGAENTGSTAGIHAPHACAHNEECFLVERHGVDDFVDVVSIEFRLSGGGESHCNSFYMIVHI